jgi:hypothetical protein
MIPAVEIKRHWQDQIIATAESISEPGRRFTVIWTARDGWRCGCMVGLRKKRCHHIDAVIDEIGVPR